MSEKQEKSENKILLVGEKETFLLRVLLKKLTDAKIECVFTPWNVNDINKMWDKTCIVTVFMDNGEQIPESVLHFLIDKMSEDDVKLISVGEKEDIDYIIDHVPGDLICRSFVRPVDNGEYVKTVTDLFYRFESGEFRKSILVVDDDPGFLSLVRDWLKSKYKVSMVSSGLQAIKWLGKNKVDLILLDYEMPVTSGPQVLEMLRSDEETKEIPVMFLTGKGDKESVMAVLSLKPEGYFLKTIGKEELLQKLGEYFVKSMH
ncbi:MAG: response regulator [Lachnospiraceae bacterium]|nr:response regulator [Lachnospiraceae bacterium]